MAVERRPWRRRWPVQSGAHRRKPTSTVSMLFHRLRVNPRPCSCQRGTARKWTATVQAYNAAGVLGDDAWNVTVPGNGFVRLNNSDLALGHDTGARKVVVMAGRELNVTAMRRIWADHAVALAVRHWVTNAVPPAMPGCADEAEFNRLAVGNEFVESEKGRVDARFLFQDGNRFVQTFDLDGGELDSGELYVPQGRAEYGDDPGIVRER